MNYIKLLIVGIILIFSSAEAAGDAGLGALWDLLSFLIVFLAPYLIVSANYSTFNIFNKNEVLDEFGALALGFGFVGFLIGAIFTTGGVANPSQGVNASAFIGAKIAISLIPVLYASIIKYVLVPILKTLNK